MLGMAIHKSATSHVGFFDDDPTRREEDSIIRGLPRLLFDQYLLLPYDLRRNWFGTISPRTPGFLRSNVTITKMKLQVFTQLCGWSIEELEILLMECRQELKQKGIHRYFKL